MSSIVSMNQFKPAEIYGRPKDPDQFGQDIILINKSTHKGLKLSLPTLYCFGVQAFRDDPNKYSFSLQFPMDNHGVPTAETDQTLSKLLQMENVIIDYMTANSSKYFGQSRSREQVKHMYVPMIKYPKIKDTETIDYNTPPYIKCRVPFYTNERMFKDFTITNESGEVIYSCPNRANPDSIIKVGTFSKCDLHFSKIWVNKKRSWGIEIKVVKVQILPETEEYEPFEIDGITYYILNKKELSFIYADGDTEDELGAKVGIFVDGEAKLFR